MPTSSREGETGKGNRKVVNHAVQKRNNSSNVKQTPIKPQSQKNNLPALFRPWVPGRNRCHQTQHDTYERGAASKKARQATRRFTAAIAKGHGPLKRRKRGSIPSRSNGGRSENRPRCHGPRELNQAKRMGFQRVSRDDTAILGPKSMTIRQLFFQSHVPSTKLEKTCKVVGF